MMPKISIDEYLSKRDLSTNDGVVYRAAKLPKSFDEEHRSAVFVMTDETPDSYRDIVRAKGADLTRFESNPIALLNHRSDMVIGTWSDVDQKPKRIEGKVTLAEQGTAPHVDMTYNLMKQGILKAASIGFIPKKIEKILDEEGEWNYGYDIQEWTMFECSVVSIPANPSALARSMKDGSVLARDLLEEVLDTYTKTSSGLIVAKSDLEDAYKEGTNDKTTVVIDAGSITVRDANDDDEMEAINEEVEAPCDLLSKSIIESFASLVEADDIVSLRDGESMSLVIERDGEAVEKLLLPDTMTIADIKEVQQQVLKATADIDRATISIDVDTAEAEEKIAALETRAESFVTKFGRLFGIKSAETEAEPEVEPVEPPSAEVMDAAREKAAAIRERLAEKGLIA